MKIKIYYQTHLLQELELKQRGDSLVVGRGSECDVVVREDRGVSTKHFKVVRERRGLRVEDLGSRNKLRFRDKVQEKVLLRVGQRLQFSRCSLELVGASDTSAGLTDPKNGYFVVESGHGKGRQFPIRDAMVIGQSEGEEMLTLPDRRISRRHAKVRFQGGQGIWIDDLASRNGTLVNGSRLEPGRERLLKDGDRVFVGGTVLEFVDGNRRSPIHVVPKAFAMALTLMVGFGLYQGYQHLRPDAGGFIEAAKSLAKAGQFDQALESLDQAVHAREYKNHRNEVSVLRQQFRVSDGFMPMWNKAREKLDAFEWDRAYPTLCALEETRTDDLIWVQDHQSILALAGDYKEGIDTIKAGRNALSRMITHPDTDVDAILKALDARQSTTATNTKALVKIRDIATGVHNDLFSARKSVQKVRNFFATVDKENPAFGALAKELTFLQLPRGELSEFRGHLIRALVLLEQGRADLDAAKALAGDRKFVDAMDQEVRLPTQREVGFHDQLKQWRTALELEMSALHSGLIDVQEAIHAVDELSEEGMAAWAHISGTRFQEALQCSSLLGKFPERRRKKPHGPYDEMFGLRGFWAFLQSGTDEILAFNDPETPALEQAARWLQSLHVLEMKMVRVDALKDGGAGELLQQTRDQLAEKDAFVTRLLEGLPEEATPTRQSILKAGTALRLVNTDPTAGERAQGLRQWLVKSLAEHETFLKEQNAAFDPFQNQEPRQKILEAGIPGCRFVQMMWVRSI